MQTTILIIIVGVIALILLSRKHNNIALPPPLKTRNCGEWAERSALQQLLNMGIDQRAIFHNCYVRKSNGTYSQIDLVVATSQGLLVFEIKDYSGWIFGHFRQKYWTQVLAYGKEKHRFYNPIMQNNSHIQALRENLPHNHGIPIYSIIVFFGDCELKNITIASSNDFIIYSSEIWKTVCNITSRPPANFGDKHEIMNVLEQAVANGKVPEIVSYHLSTSAFANRSKPLFTRSFSINKIHKPPRFRRF